MIMRLSTLLSVFVLFCCLFLRFCTNAVSNPKYESETLSGEVNEAWSFESLAETTRAAINNARSFPWELVSLALKGGQQDVLINKVIDFEMAFIVPAGILLVLGIIVPIVGFIVCCCRCFNNCGGRLTIYDIRKQETCSKLTLGGFLFLVAIFVGTFTFGIPESGRRMTSGPALALNVVSASLSDVLKFVEHFVVNVQDVAEEELQTLIDDVKDDLKGIPETLSEPLMEKTKKPMQNIRDEIERIKNGMSHLDFLENRLNITVEHIQTNGKTLDHELDKVSANLTAIKNQCTLAAESFCEDMMDGSEVEIDVDFDQLNEVSALTTDLASEARKIDLDVYLNMTDDAFGELPSVINDSSTSAIDSHEGAYDIALPTILLIHNGVIEILDDIPDDALSMLSSITELSNQTSSMMNFSENFDLAWSYVKLMDEQSQIKNFGLYGLSAVLGIIAVLCFLGLCVGCAFTRRMPNDGRLDDTIYFVNGRSIGGSIGAVFIWCSFALSTLFLLFFCLFAAVFLLFGANLTVMCQPLQDLSVFDKILGDDGLYPLNGSFSLGDSNFSIDIDVKAIIIPSIMCPLSQQRSHVEYPSVDLLSAVFLVGKSGSRSAGFEWIHGKKLQPLILYRNPFYGFQRGSCITQVTIIDCGCGKGGTVFSVLNLSQVLDMHSMFNSSEFAPNLTDIYADINSTIQNISVTDDKSFENLTSTFTFRNVNGTNYTDEVRGGVEKLKLSEIITNVTNLAEGFGNEVYAAPYRQIAARLRELNMEEMANVNHGLDLLTQDVDELNLAVHQLEGNVEYLVANLTDLEDFIHNNATDIVIQNIEHFETHMVDIAENFLNYMETKLSTDIGKCKIVQTIYDVMVGAVCIYLLDGLNVFWVCLYMSSFFAILLMIFSLRMVKYFKKPDERIEVVRNAW